MASLSFRTKTILGIAVIESLMLIALVWSGYQQLRESTNEQIAQRAQTTVALFATLAKDPILAMDLASLESFTQEMVRNPGVVYVRVIGYGKVLASAGTVPALDRPDDKAGDDLADGVFDSSRSVVAGGEVFGEVQVGLSNARIAEILVSATRSQLFIAAMEILAVGVFSWILGVHLTRQLDNIRSGVKALSEGERDVRIREVGNDELTDMARGFNVMSQRLQQSERALRDEAERSRGVAVELVEKEQSLRFHKDHLEELVLSRTRDLERLADAHARFIETANAPIFSTDVNGLIQTWNQKAQELTGISKKLAIGRRWFEIVEATDEDLSGTRDGEIKVRDNCEMYVKSSSGKDLLWMVGIKELTTASGKHGGYAFVGYDTTERHEIQAQMMHRSKLATLGEMATGVAHELNQPLVVISMAVENCIRKLGRNKLTDDVASEKFQTIRDQVARATTIIDHMRIFGRRSDDRPTTFSVDSAVQDASKLMAEHLRLRQIDLSVVNDGVRNALVLGHKSQLEQVLINLVGNARDSIEASGTDERMIEIVQSVSHHSVTLEVSDTGGGIPSDIEQRIFEPFVTSKGEGEGTGLGLSISYGIVKAMGGSIDAKNEATGARFSVVLPLARLELAG